MVKLSETMVARQNVTDSRLGHLFWFTISQGLVEIQEYKRVFAESGLDSKYTLPELRPADVFRRASKNIEKRMELSDSNGKEKINLLCRDVACDSKEIVRHIVIERRNSESRKLDYEECAAVLSFDHVTKGIDADIMVYEDYVIQAVDSFEDNFRLYQNAYDGNAIRRMVTRILEDLSAASVKESGGVYLVPRMHEETLFNLERFVKKLSQCSAHKLPVEDTGEARDMVREVVTNKAQSMLKEIRNVLKAQTDGVIDERTVQSLIKQAHAVKQDVVVYQHMLQESIGTLQTDAELLSQQMMALIDKLV